MNLIYLILIFSFINYLLISNSPFNNAFPFNFSSKSNIALKLVRIKPSLPYSYFVFKNFLINLFILLNILIKIINICKYCYINQIIKKFFSIHIFFRNFYLINIQLMIHSWIKFSSLSMGYVLD